MIEWKKQSCLRYTVYSWKLWVFSREYFVVIVNLYYVFNLVNTVFLNSWNLCFYSCEYFVFIVNTVSLYSWIDYCVHTREYCAYILVITLSSPWILCLKLGNTVSFVLVNTVSLFSWIVCVYSWILCLLSSWIQCLYTREYFVIYSWIQCLYTRE